MMEDYTRPDPTRPDNFFGHKDTLNTGDSEKKILGADVDRELNGLVTYINELNDHLTGVEGDIPSVEGGAADGEVLCWSDGAEKWIKTDTLKVQPTDAEIVARGDIVTQPMLMNQSTQAEVGYVNGHAGMIYRCERYENANDPWSGVNGLNWEVGFVSPRDAQTDPKRKNGFDVVADRFTARITRDYQGDWWDTEIVFRADGDELELGSRRNPQTVRVNGALTCTNSTELGNDNSDQHVLHGDVYVGYQDPNNVPDTSLGDVTPGTLFLSRGVKLVRDPSDNTAHSPSFNANGFKLVQLGDADSNDQAPNWGQVKAYVGDSSRITDDVSVNNNGIKDVITNWDNNNDATNVEGVLGLGHGLRDSILVAVQTSNDFETLKQRLVDVLTNFDVRAAAKGNR